MENDYVRINMFNVDPDQILEMIKNISEANPDYRVMLRNHVLHVPEQLMGYVIENYASTIKGRIMQDANTVNNDD